MTRFRPCIDLHHGCVKQIVGGTLRDDDDHPLENYVADHPASWFAAKYRQDNLSGGHVIQLGGGNQQAAREALAEYPGGMQLGGGVTADNAADWIDAGASHVIVTSWLFDQHGQLQPEKLEKLCAAVGRQRVVLDLSCRRTGTPGSAVWTVAMNRWQTLTEIDVTPENLDRLSRYAAEFLVHAADVEGLCRGIDQDLVRLLGRWAGLPMTYAGGVATLDDVRLVEQLSGGSVDVTVGSALDLFGGTGVRYDDLVHWNQQRK